MIERKLTDKGWSRFCAFLAEVGNEETIATFHGYWTREKAKAAWRENLHTAINDGGDVIGFEIGSSLTACRNPVLFFMNNQDWTEIEIFDD